ncbi:MAG: DUF3853 family protein [Treponema sp.]|nr:DUF3853 family protein [Treponema sp.]
MSNNRILVRSSKELAKLLCVSRNTISRWRNLGILEDATVVDYGRTLIYDLEKVYECLNRVGRKGAIADFKRQCKIS